MTDKDFYEQCAAILDAKHLGEPFAFYKRTRWNNRKAGQGRFEGAGIIRCFGEKVHIALNYPLLNKICNSKAEALEELSNAQEIADLDLLISAIF